MSDRKYKQTMSFIIPVLNGEKFMADCIDHVVAEMGVDDELIVVDNGSTDGTLDIVRRYGRATILQFPESTIASLRNRGADIATGDLLAFIDSDVVLCEGWREAVQSVLQDESVHATGSKYDIPQQPHWIEQAWYSKRIKNMAPVKYINSGNLIVRKEAFKAIGGFDDKLITDEDYDFGQRLNHKALRIIEAPQIRTIHLGNPKSMWNFYKKEKWHATSSLNSLEQGNIDKPTFMTMVFSLCVLIAMLMLPSVIKGGISPFRPLVLLLCVPLLTAVYRARQYRAYGHIPALIILYFLFYIARGLTFLHYLYERTLGRLFRGKNPRRSR